MEALSLAGLISIHVSCFRHEGSFVRLGIDTKRTRRGSDSRINLGISSAGSLKSGKRTRVPRGPGKPVCFAGELGIVYHDLAVLVEISCKIFLMSVITSRTGKVARNSVERAPGFSGSKVILLGDCFLCAAWAAPSGYSNPGGRYGQKTAGAGPAMPAASAAAAMACATHHCPATCGTSPDSANHQSGADRCGPRRMQPRSVRQVLRRNIVHSDQRSLRADHCKRGDPAG